MTKSVAIIGASRGIGLGFALAYAGEGWNTHVTTRAIGCLLYTYDAADE
mgnify:CR=1 FL=1